MNSHDAPQPHFAVISGKVVHQIITQAIPEVTQVIEAAYLAHEQGETVNPDSYFLRFPHNPTARIIALPAHLQTIEQAEQGISGIKWIASYPDNLSLGIPRASAVLLLNDGQTGYPFACLEASIISAVRTAASAVLGAWHLNHKNKNLTRLTIIGTGLIARFVVRFLIGMDWHIEEVVLYDRHSQYSQSFKQHLADNYTFKQVTLANTDSEAVQASEMIVLTTTASEPYLTDLSLFKHNPLVLNISLRDIGAEVILNATNVVDDIDHCLKANTSPHLAVQKVGHRDFIFGTLPEILQDKKLLPPRDKPVVFSPFGMGILDLALGYFVYQQAEKTDQLIEIPNFFYEMQRI